MYIYIYIDIDTYIYIYIYILGCFAKGSSPGRFLMRLPTTSLGIRPLMFSACTGLSGATDRSGSQWFPVDRKESFWS